MAKKTKVEELIAALETDLKPVRPLHHPFLRVMPVMIVVLAYLAGVIHFLGIRMDIMDRLHDSAYLYELGLTVVISITAAYSAGLLSIPDMHEKTWFLAVPSSLFAALFLWMCCEFGIEAFAGDVNISHLSWSHCFSDAMLMAFVPIVALVMLVRKGATTRPKWMAFMSVLSVGALGWASLRITCIAEHSEHIMIFHFMPFVILGTICGLLANRIYKW